MRSLKTVPFLALWLALLLPAAGASTADLVIYGGTSAGVVAAVQAKRMGRSVVIVCPDRHLGGLSSGGLGFTDTGDKSVIGGLTREFYHRVYLHYQEPGAWKWQRRQEYGNKGQGTAAVDGDQRTMWVFEPHVAEKIFEDLIREHGITVDRDQWLNRTNGVRKVAGRIESIRMLSGREYAGAMFIDATYEGDLMAAAGVTYHVGREAQSVYGEKWNGVQTGVLHHGHHFGALEDQYFSVRGSWRSDERGVGPDQHGAARGIRGRRQPGPGLLLPLVPDRSSGESRAVPETRRI